MILSTFCAVLSLAATAISPSASALEVSAPACGARTPASAARSSMTRRHAAFSTPDTTRPSFPALCTVSTLRSAAGSATRPCLVWTVRSRRSTTDKITSLRISPSRVMWWCALAAFAACLATTATSLPAWVVTTSQFTAAARVRVFSPSPSAATPDTRIRTLAASTTRATRPASCLTLAARPFLSAAALIPATHYLATRRCLRSWRCVPAPCVWTGSAMSPAARTSTPSWVARL
mmetsp:Transcript_31066/g.53256  ORF Transcript_31066/g.53256 Transcript_31066/m.53256 type:complete len:234 (-) Transcript_31066:337-1038(-)